MSMIQKGKIVGGLLQLAVAFGLSGVHGNELLANGCNKDEIGGQLMSFIWESQDHPDLVEFNTILKAAIECKVDLNRNDYDNSRRSPLLAAVNVGSPDEVKALLESGADPNRSFENYDNFTPLGMAVHVYHPNVLSVVDLLLAYKADPLVWSPSYPSVISEVDYVISYLTEGGELYGTNGWRFESLDTLRTLKLKLENAVMIPAQ